MNFDFFKKSIDAIKDIFQQDKNYTIMFVPHDGEAIKKASLENKNFRVLIIGAIVCLVVGMGFVGRYTYIMQRAEKEHAELVVFNEVKTTQEAKLNELSKSTENLQKEMAEISVLERDVRRQLEKAGGEESSTSRGGVEREDIKFDSSGPKGGGNHAGLSKIEVLTAQNNYLAQELVKKKENLNVLYEELKSYNYNEDVTPSVWPTNGGYVSSRYGGRDDPFGYGGGDWHPGIDIAEDYGAPVYATASGYVSQAGWNGGYGLYVLVNHDYGVSSAYAHMSDVAVHSGAFVEKGEVIGYVGSTGYSTGPHLHFEILHNGETVNPMKYFK